LRYHISHTTRYLYPQPIKLGPQTVRLRPRSDGSQHLQQFSVTILPQPDKLSEILDMEGNVCLRLWFPDTEITELKIHVEYPRAIAAHLAPYFQPALATQSSPQVVDLAQTLLHDVQSNVGLFLSQLTQTIYQEFQYFHRPDGDPQPAGITMRQQAGSCRDFAVLFMEACQAVGLAARFVSGYQEGDEEQESRELHAWPEVYIPGGGWRGFDPTHGLAVSDRHVPLAAAAHPKNAAPVSGTLQPGYFAQSTLEYEIQLARSPE